MAPQPTLTQIRLNNVITCLTLAITTLDELQDVFGTPFLGVISSTTLSLITALETVKRNKDGCAQLMEDIHRIIFAIIDLHMRSESREIHGFTEAQRDGNKFKQFFHQNEMNQLLQDCNEDCRKLFISSSIDDMRKATEKQQQELLELIATLSDDRVSSMTGDLSSLENSSVSLSLLPSQPKIFHGRDSELQQIINTLLSHESARIAILGAGGMGKTSLAKAVLHQPAVAAKYEYRLFIGSEHVTTSIGLAALISAHLGLKPGKDLTNPVLRHFSKGPQCLLILDNLETSWEPLDSRSKIEQFLSLLTDIPHLTLIITMRGAERPEKVHWTRPFLIPLNPLTYEAACQTFIDIADDFHNKQDVDHLLRLTDNLPLAVDLVAHLVDYEGCAAVLARWKTEKTSMLSSGYDRMSSLDASITVSLSSPRITSLPGSKELLSLLSILPDGLSDIILLQSNLPIKDILACKTALLRTSLAYVDDKGRLKVLVPIREHVHSLSSPSWTLVRPLQKYFSIILEFCYNYYGHLSDVRPVAQITSNLANIENILLQGFTNDIDNVDLSETVLSSIQLNEFARLNNYGRHSLMDQIPHSLPQLADHKLEGCFITETFASWMHQLIPNPEALVEQGLEHFHHLGDLGLEARFCRHVGNYYLLHENDLDKARHFFESGLSLSRSCRATTEQGLILDEMALVQWKLGDYAEAHLLKSEYADARNIHTQILSQISMEKDAHSCAFSLLNIAEIDIMTGTSASSVQQNLDKVKMIFQRVEYPIGMLCHNMISADLILWEGDHLSAKKFFLQCLDIARGTDAEAVIYCLERLGDMKRWELENTHTLSGWVTLFLGYAIKFQNMRAIYKALSYLGDICLAQHDENTAFSLFTVALQGFTKMDIHQSKADCMVCLGNIADKQGDLGSALNLWKTAGALFALSSQAHDVVCIDAKLAAAEQW
ncbi:hypothetical protein C8R44DRAFT_852876 [Mycena epipterygia]|nr:hypothetical protein C8R44DRAFT_852876 [Mycena epipterygia]